MPKSTKAPDETKRRGPGRPPLTPGGGVTSAHRIRLSQGHQEELACLVMDGVASNASEAIRYLIDQSADRRGSDGAPKLR